jgi:DNA-binding NtrC family response regulator
MRLLATTPSPESLFALAGEVPEHEFVIEPTVGRLVARLNEYAWPLVLLDVRADDVTLELVQRLAGSNRRVALMSPTPSVALVINALNHGACDVLTFPPDARELGELLSRCGEWQPGPSPDSAEGGACSVEAAPAARHDEDALDESAGTGLIGRSPGILGAVKTVARVANSAATALVLGESGTGKELIARLLHDRSSRSRAGAFVAVNCAAIPEALLESELFGHEQGAFTGAIARRIGKFERATGGTLFLDEIGEMALPLQAKILRALQEREVERVGGSKPIGVDVRVVAATQRDLEQEITAGRFREDLYYRLAVVVINLPPLRERGDDIRLLAEHCVHRAAREHGRPAPVIAPETMEHLRAHPWPGNVRQLRNAMERAVLLSDGPVLLPAHLPMQIRNHPSLRFLQGIDRRTPHDRRGRRERRNSNPGVDVVSLDALERDYLVRALIATGGHLGRAATLLGIHRNTLRHKLRAHGISASNGVDAGARSLDAGQAPSAEETPPA